MPLSSYAQVQTNPLRLPLTPPNFWDGLDKEADDDIISLATHVIATERDALANLHNLYQSDPAAQRSFKQALHVMGKTSRQGGRIIVSGMGKSGKIGQKFVATLNSFGIRSAFLHPTEAMHGDLAPIPSTEVDAFGVPTPTSSTTTALALTDALALALARRLHPNPTEIFHHYHPGGTIGASAAPTAPQLIGSIATNVDDVPIILDGQGPKSPTVLDALLTAARSASGWVRASSDTIIAPRQIQRIGRKVDLKEPLSSIGHAIVVEKLDWISIPAANSIQEAQEWILSMRQTSRGRTFLKPGTILGIVDSQKCVSGVVEIEEIMTGDQLQ
ncbi:MAG: hypothetical protein Q9176_000026 [Flavoplaca citrina]